MRGLSVSELALKARVTGDDIVRLEEKGEKLGLRKYSRIVKALNNDYD